MCRLGQGEAREWSAVARRSHRGADRADIVFRFRSSLSLPKMEVALAVSTVPGVVGRYTPSTPSSWTLTGTSSRVLLLDHLQGRLLLVQAPICGQEVWW